MTFEFLEEIFDGTPCLFLSPKQATTRHKGINTITHEY